MGGFNSRVNPERLGWYLTMFVYHFVDSDLRVIFRKRKSNRTREIDFEIEDETSHAHYLGSISCLFSV